MCWTVIIERVSEHVEGDPRMNVIGAGFNFPFVSHLRHFFQCDEVSISYAVLSDDLNLHRVPLNEHGKSPFILQGTRKGGP